MEKLSHLEICRIFELPVSEFQKLVEDPEFRKKIYRNLQRNNHPDTKPPEERAKYTKITAEINKAYEALNSANYYYESPKSSAYNKNNYDKYKQSHETSQSNASNYEDNKTEKKYHYNEYYQQSNEGTQYSYQSYERAPDCFLKREGLKLVLWVLLWPVRGIVYLTVSLLISAAKLSLALLVIPGLFGGIAIIVSIVKEFNENPFTLGLVIEMWPEFLLLIFIACVFGCFNFLDENGEDWLTSLYYWWRD